MADFDNGLPPQGTDITGSEMSAVLIDKAAEVKEGGIYSISAVVMEKEEAQLGDVWAVSSVLLDKQEAEYHNRCMFL